MRGNITRRGRHSWRIKFDAGTSADGKRLIEYETILGARRDAEAALAKRLTELADGRYVPPTAETVGSYAFHWLENIAPATRSAITVQRYRSIITTYIIPGLGEAALQSGSTARILIASTPFADEWAVLRGWAAHL